MKMDEMDVSLRSQPVDQPLECLTELDNRRNTVAPIQTIPVEITLKILTVLVLEEAKRGTSYFPLLNDLSLVCRAWANIVNGHPDFWATARVGDSMSVVERGLVRSRDCPLHVVFDDPRHSKSHADLREYCAAVESHRHRWQTLRVVIGTKTELEAMLESKLLESKGPTSLEGMVAIDGSPGGEVAVLDLLGSHAPNLQCIWLWGFVMRDWNSSLLSNLKLLALGLLGRDAAPTLQRVIEILQHSPDLREFHLKSIQFHLPTLPDLCNDVIPIQLEKLCKISLLRMEPAVVTYLLASLKTPQCNLYEYIVINADEDVLNTFAAFTAHVQPRMKLLAETTVAVSVKIERGQDAEGIVGLCDGITIALYDVMLREEGDPEEDGMIKFTVIGVPALDVVRWLASEDFRLFASLPVEACIRVEVNNPLGLESESFCDSLLCLPETTELIVRRTRQPEVIIKGLARSINEREDGSLEWRFPKLTRLVLEGCPGITDEATIEALSQSFGAWELHDTLVLEGEDRIVIRALKKALYSYKR